jgi:hypothetical protein
MTVGHNVTLTLDLTILFLGDIIYWNLALQVGGELDYLHLSPASLQRRVLRVELKVTQCPGV